MGYTVVGLFGKKDEAKAAYDELVDGIFEDKQIDVSPYKITGDNANVDSIIEEDSKTRGLWARLFGSNSKEHDSYSLVAARTHIITVHANSKKDAEIAVEILDKCGAVDVDKLEEEINDNNNLGISTGSSDYNIEVLGQDIGMTQTEKKDILGDPLRSNFVVTNSENSINDIKHTDETILMKGEDLNGLDLMDKSDEESETIEVLEEEISVSKKEVETGTVSIRSRIIEKPVEEEIRLRKERVYVTRKPINKIVESEDAFKNEKIEMIETAEVAVVEKSIRLVEEISLNKEIIQNDKVIKDTLRQTEISIEGDD